MRRAFSAFGFGAAVTGGQVLGVVVALFVAGAVSVVSSLLAIPVAIVSLVLAVGGSPAMLHSRLANTRFAPSTTLRATIVLALGGLALGQVIGAMFERGHLRGGGWPSIAGALAGSFILVSLANLRAGAELVDISFNAA